jgi:hypothetical protein
VLTTAPASTLYGVADLAATTARTPAASNPRASSNPVRPRPHTSPRPGPPAPSPTRQSRPCLRPYAAARALLSVHQSQLRPWCARAHPAQQLNTHGA